MSLISAALAGGFFTTRATWEALCVCVCGGGVCVYVCGVCGVCVVLCVLLFSL